MMINRFSHISLIRLAGLIIWLSLSVPFVMKVFIDPQWLNSKSILWLLSHLSFGIGFIILTKHLGHEKLNKDEWVLLFAMIAVIYIINWSTISMSGMFYSLIIAILLPWIMSVKQGVLILILQNLLLAWQLFADMQYWEEFESMQAGRVILQFYWIGISSFSYILSLVAFRQQNAKEELRKLNSELRATQVLLAESSRINERLRISRELHDLIGHHLTALSLNLEVASHITKNKAQEHVKKAQSIARLLLSDVRNVVSAFRNKGNLNFYQAIVELTDDIPKLNIHIDIDVFQTGSGTSSNMNCNEVISHLASTDDLHVHPNDHVNMGQSSNDVIPTTIAVSAVLNVREKLIPALDYIEKICRAKAEELKDVVKTGRTHLMDAMPVTFAQELNTWADLILRNKQRITDATNRLSNLPQGGTAVGTGINADKYFGVKFAAQLSAKTGSSFHSMENKFEGIGSQDGVVELSGQLKTLASTMMKIANDLRWMNSGPLAGIGEIALPSLQPGSSIMPGKVNPVIPEAMAMVCAQVMGNDTTISIAGASGNFQLNVMLPIIGLNILQSIEIMSNSIRVMADSAIKGFIVNHDTVAESLNRNPILVTALNAIIGYDLGAKIAKTAYKEGRAVIDVALEHTELSREELEKHLNPLKLTLGGIGK